MSTGRPQERTSNCEAAFFAPFVRPAVLILPAAAEAGRNGLTVRPQPSRHRLGALLSRERSGLACPERREITAAALFARSPQRRGRSRRQRKLRRVPGHRPDFGHEAIDEPARLRTMFARFSAPVFPGETIRIEFHETDEIRFKATVKERGIVVLDRCGALVDR